MAMAKKSNAMSTAMMRIHIVGDKTDAEIVGETGWPLEDVKKLRAEVYTEEEVRLVGRRGEEVYVQYALRMGGLVKELDTAVDELKTGSQGDRQGAAIMSGIKAKAAMHDRVIKLGQQMGFVRKVPESKIIILAGLSDRELAQHLQVQMRRLDTMVDRYGGKDVIDLDPDKIQPVLSMQRIRPVVEEVGTSKPPAAPKARLNPPDAQRRRGPVRRKASSLPRGSASE